MNMKHLSPLDHLKIAVMDAKCSAELDRAYRGKDRAAGSEKSDKKANKKSSNDNKTGKKTTDNKEQEAPKTEEQKKAEAEYPGEEPGAEKINDEKQESAKAQEPVEASMGNPAATPQGEDPNKKVSVVFDFDAMAGQPEVTPNPANQVVGNAGQPAGFYPYPPNFYQNPYTAWQQQNIQPPMPGQGRHAVDNPQAPKQPIKKADADQVDINLEGVNVEAKPPKPQREWPEVVANPLPQAEHVEAVITPKYDNSEITSALKYMADIERVALETGHQVQMHRRLGPNGQPDGLITVVTFNEGNVKPNPFKGFTIDTGCIIDRRVKMFPTVVQYGFEDYQAYPVLIPVDDPNRKGKSKNMFNQKLFEDFFKGGIAMLNEKDGMYTLDYRELNKLVAVITMPTNHMNGETRRKVRDKLFSAMKAGVFAEALKFDPGSRFRFADYDKKTGNFTLSNVGVPIRYDGPVTSKIPIEIKFEQDKATLVHPNMI